MHSTPPHPLFSNTFNHKAHTASTGHHVGNLMLQYCSTSYHTTTNSWANITARLVPFTTLSRPQSNPQISLTIPITNHVHPLRFPLHQTIPSSLAHSRAPALLMPSYPRHTTAFISTISTSPSMPSISMHIYHSTPYHCPVRHSHHHHTFCPTRFVILHPSRNPGHILIALHSRLPYITMSFMASLSRSVYQHLHTNTSCLYSLSLLYDSTHGPASNSCACHPILLRSSLVVVLP